MCWDHSKNKNKILAKIWIHKIFFLLIILNWLLTTYIYTIEYLILIITFSYSFNLANLSINSSILFYFIAHSFSSHCCSLYKSSTILCIYNYQMKFPNQAIFTISLFITKTIIFHHNPNFDLLKCFSIRFCCFFYERYCL